MSFEKDVTGMKRRLTRYGDDAFALFLRKAFIKGMGLGDEALAKPVIGIINTASDFNPCHGNSDELVQCAKDGVLAAGALPLAFPTISLHESFAFPTSMYLRNLMAMDTEEMLKALPLDGAILVGGCDKTVPAQIMGAFSARLPFIQLVTGPMSTGSVRGERVGACTDCRRFWAAYRAGTLKDDEIADINNQLVPTIGTCGVMGTASSMALISEAMGLMVPNSACAPAVSADRRRIAEQTGQRATQMAIDSHIPADFIDERSIENALRVLMAIGGSTNAIVHLAAMAGRLGLSVDLNELDEIGRETPVIVDLKPSGDGYMEDLHRAGGLARVLHEIKHLLHLDAMTVSGKPLGDVMKQSQPNWPQTVVKPFTDPIYPHGGLAVLRGNLAPDGAIIKQSAAHPDLLIHKSRAVVFDGMADLAERIDNEDEDFREDDILVLRNIGPKGAPGMPEAGLIPIPKKLARAGIKDMVRISDGRMSGTAAGTIILHVAPEAAVGGPLNLVQTGDIIDLDVPSRTLSLLVNDVELERRRQETKPLKQAPSRGYAKLFHEQVTQAPEGADFLFLQSVDRS